MRVLRRAALAAALLASPLAARADNAMGYRLLTQEDAARLPNNHGALGLDIARAQRIEDAGMAFDILRVARVRDRSPAARAGLREGDDIIAADGQVFATIRAFAAYIGSRQAGQSVTLDYIPRGGGPGQAQRVAVPVGGAGAERSGLSTGQKLAIGAGAVALLGCYEMGCFSHRATPAQQ